MAESPHRPFRLRNALQHFYAALHHTIEGVHAKHQAKFPHAMHLAEHTELVSEMCSPVSWLFPDCVAATNERRITLPTMRHGAEVYILIDDNDIEGRRRCGRGEYSFEENRCGVVGAVNRFRCGLKRSK